MCWKELKKGFANMGGKPETVYSDDEGALNSKEIQAQFCLLYTSPSPRDQA